MLILYLAIFRLLNFNLGQIVEVPTPRIETTPTPMDKPPLKAESETPAIPVMPPDPSNFVMNSGLNGQPSFMPFSHPMNQPNPMFYGTGYPRPDPSNALTSVNSGVKEDVLQAILNSPGQLQRFMQLLSSQQAPMPPPLDLNAPAPQPDGITNPDRQSATLQGQIPSTAPLAIQNGFNFPTVDPGALSLLQPEEMAPMSFEPLVSNENQLDGTYKDADAIAQDIDDIQTSLDSLINNLGFDPDQTGHIPELDAQDNGDGSYTAMQPDNFTQHSLSTMPSGYTTASQPPLTDSTLNTDSGLPEFDFNAFINELTLQQNAGENTTNGIHELNPDGLDSLTPNADGASTSPHLSAFVDEINSVSAHSNASSPSASRDMEGLVNASTAGAGPQVAKKARKRKSDADATAERAQAKMKRKR